MADQQRLQISELQLDKISRTFNVFMLEDEEGEGGRKGKIQPPTWFLVVVFWRRSRSEILGHQEGIFGNVEALQGLLF